MPTDWRRAVMVAANLLESNPHLDDDDWVAGLQTSGLTEDEARVTVAMLPVAFGRAWLIEHGMTRFANSFRAYDGKDRAVAIKYSRQPVFQAAVDLALAASHHGALERRHFESIAARSVEVKIVLHVRNSGENIDAAQIVSGVMAPSSLFVQERPWWKFW